MQTPETTEGTVAPGEAHAEGGLPQMNVETFPSQIFWLVITFVFLLVVMSKVALPRIGGTIVARKERIGGDLESADRLRKDAAEALAGYEKALAAARGRATALAEENRKLVTSAVDKQKAAADAESQASIAEAESRIDAARRSASTQVRDVASDAAAEIVERLIGERVDKAAALRAVEAARG